MYQKLFTKITISQKFNKILQLFKNCIAVCTSSFHTRANVIKKNNGTPMPLITTCVKTMLIKTLPN